ncbi:hypothetical protein APUTEX25_000143 [Auxenochlorella protothecoides]|uniref:Dihydrolipoamide acetyltransferase component of pyruvate dehydrogenase complex n=1 Tax=Auxenochlorella protothecoides TaxID=3075 RepID=A0A3M7L0H6_AUXPR|nr:hypothetical protein APUTEX25_000143 [Auxenochlorella protothecoides]|eukprot:RMZ55560.1 hypothetical protein APUTEX25_000143 [Auxenochlorella protothecoides]
MAGVPPARPGAVARGRSGRVALHTVAAVKDVFMPALSSTMTEGKIVSWLKSPGDKVAKGESIVVVESDKADMDVEAFAEGILGSITVPEGGVAGVSELKGTTVPLSGLQQAVSKNMLASLAVPEFRVSMTIGTGAFDALYRKLKGKGVSMTALLSKAVAVALESHPLLYASATADGSGVTYAEHINIANAVAMPDGGLITPVLADADAADIYTLSRSWADLVKRARAKQLSPNEYSSGTFTISNLGMYGVEAFDAVLPPGTAAILAVGGSRPVVTAGTDGRIGVEKQMTVNLTADHRIVYGAQAAEFLVTLKAVIESPEQLVY